MATGTRVSEPRAPRQTIHPSSSRVGPVGPVTVMRTVADSPGESARFRVVVTGPARPGALDDGWIVWRGARGGETRIPVALTR